MKFIVDGNAFLHVSTRQVLGILTDKYPAELTHTVDGAEVITDFAKQQFKQITLGYLNTFLIPFQYSLDSLFFTLDNISWRKEYVEKFFDRNPTHNRFAYKGNRKHDKDYTLLNEFFDYFSKEVSDILREIPGCYVISTIGAEGDDIIAYITERFPNEDIAIWTGDYDISQLATDKNRNVIILGPKHITTKKRRITTNANKTKFNLQTNPEISSIITRLLSSNFYEKVEANPGKDTLIKLVTKDQSDNIGSIYVRKTKTDKYLNITQKRGAKFLKPIFENYSDSEILNKIDTLDINLFNEVIATLETEFKLDFSGDAGEKLYEKIHKNYERNVKLIRLSKHQIPEILFQMIERVFNFYYKEGTTFDYAAFAANLKESRYVE